MQQLPFFSFFFKKGKKFNIKSIFKANLPTKLFRLTKKEDELSDFYRSFTLRGEKKTEPVVYIALQGQSV